MPALTTPERDELAELMASAVAPHLAHAVHLEDAERIEELLLPLDWQELVALAVVLAARNPLPTVRPDDGVVDDVAVKRACKGEPIPLTTAERLAAGRILAAEGVGPTEAARLLHIAKTTAERLLNKARAEQTDAACPPITADRAAVNRAVIAALDEDPALENPEGTE